MVYLIFMGLAPTIVGSISDIAGRRPAYLLCFIVYIAANIGLSLQDSYAALMVLRCLQSSGSSGTVALGNAMVADIATSSERGSYIGYASVGALVGPAGKSFSSSLDNTDFELLTYSWTHHWWPPQSVSRLACHLLVPCHSLSRHLSHLRRRTSGNMSCCCRKRIHSTTTLEYLPPHLPQTARATQDRRGSATTAASRA